MLLPSRIYRVHGFWRILKTSGSFADHEVSSLRGLEDFHSLKWFNKNDPRFFLFRAGFIAFFFYLEVFRFFRVYRSSGFEKRHDLLEFVLEPKANAPYAFWWNRVYMKYPRRKITRSFTLLVLGLKQNYGFWSIIISFGPPPSGLVK